MELARETFTVARKFHEYPVDVPWHIWEFHGTTYEHMKTLLLYFVGGPPREFRALRRGKLKSVA